MTYIFIIIFISFLSYINSISQNCSQYTDCFNCTLSLKCEWSNNTCFPYQGENIIPEINATKNITNYTILYQHINYIRDACFEPVIPYVSNDKQYNLLSEFYCGKKQILYNTSNFSIPFEISLNKINGRYGTPNILCQYDILTGGDDSYSLNIDINENFTNNFMLIYLNDTESIGAIINKTTKFDIPRPALFTNSFIYYGYSSFDSPPFHVDIKNIKESELLSYIYLSMLILGVLVVFIGITYIRCFSTKLKEIRKKNNNPEEMRLNENDENVIDRKDEDRNQGNRLSIINEKGEEMEMTKANENM